jgi:uroporphyrinogen III methyltransferase/synthase
MNDRMPHTFCQVKPKGMVYLVGAGPGDAGLLTLRGAELLKRAEVVVYDALVNAELLQLAPKSAEIIYGGKRAKGHAVPQENLNRLLIEKAREGKTVVRLKGGDPYVFGRGGEEAEELADAKVLFEVVPGVSSFVAVPNYAGVPLTHRGFCSKLTLITGHEDPAKEESKIDWAQVAKTPGTKVIMMGTDRIGEIAKMLMEYGMDAQTPVAVTQWGTTDRQVSISAPLAEIGNVAMEKKIGPPTVAVIGEVVNLREKLNWFEQRPLFGKRVIVTRSREQAGKFSDQLREKGAEVVEAPAIRIEAPTNRQALVDALLELNSYDWLVFTSPNGVSQFFEYFFRQFHDMRDIGGARIAAVGPATANKLKELHLQVDLMPVEALATSIAEEFAGFESVENLKICLLRAEMATPELPQALEAMGAIVDDIACYRTVPETDDPAGSGEKIEEEGADWVTFTSGSTVDSFHKRFDLPRLLKKFPQMKVASIGPETSKALEALKVKIEVEAKEHTAEGLAAAVVNTDLANRLSKSE